MMMMIVIIIVMVVINVVSRALTVLLALFKKLKVYSSSNLYNSPMGCRYYYHNFTDKERERLSNWPEVT